jgi:hypothetical protein
VLGLCRKLIFPQLCHMRGEEPLVVLRVVDDGPALPAVVHYEVDDIGSRSPLRNAINTVIGAHDRGSSDRQGSVASGLPSASGMEVQPRPGRLFCIVTRIKISGEEIEEEVNGLAHDLCVARQSNF